MQLIDMKVQQTQKVFKDIRVGQGIVYNDELYNRTQYGVVLDVKKDSIVFSNVFCMDKYTKCYDMAGANYDTDRDNVQLKDCPPPFSVLSKNIKKNVYTYANMNQPQVFSKQQVRDYNVRIIDGGKTISKYDMKEVRNHPWQEQLQKEKVVVDKSAMAEEKFGNLFNNENESDYTMSL